MLIRGLNKHWLKRCEEKVKCVGLMSEPIMTHQAGAYSGFYSIKRLGVELPLGRMLVHRRLPSQLILLPITPGWSEESRVNGISQAPKRAVPSGTQTHNPSVISLTPFHQATPMKIYFMILRIPWAHLRRLWRKILSPLANIDRCRLNTV